MKRLWRKIDNQAVECRACEWRCKIPLGKAGICGVRQNQGGELKLVVRGKPAEVALDPIEKKPLFHFLPGSSIYSIGTVGCNLKCEFCQNWEISQSRYTINDKRATRVKEIVDYCVKNKINSIAFTYNEPTILSEWAREIMKQAKKRQIYGVYVSNGYMTNDVLDYLEGEIDAYNIDLKSFSERYYQNICHARLAPVLKNIKEIYRRKKWLEITTLVVPGKNDSHRELKEIAEFIAGVSPSIPWHVSAFRPEYLMMEVEATKKEKLEEAYEIGKKTGLKYVYAGNVYDLKMSSTVCPGCGLEAIIRDGYEIRENKLKTGVCPKCGDKIEGVWE